MSPSNATFKQDLEDVEILSEQIDGQNVNVNVFY